MTTPIDVMAEPLASILRASARQVGADPDEAISTGWLLAQRAAARGRGAGWIVTATRRILARGMIPAGVVRIDDDDTDGRALAEVLAAPESVPMERWRTAELPEHMEAALNSGSAGLASRLGVTRRRAQQILAGAAEHASQGDLFGFAAGKRGV